MSVSLLPIRRRNRINIHEETDIEGVLDNKGKVNLYTNLYDLFASKYVFDKVMDLSKNSLTELKLNF